MNLTEIGQLTGLAVIIVSIGAVYADLRARTRHLEARVEAAHVKIDKVDQELKQHMVKAHEKCVSGDVLNRHMDQFQGSMNRVADSVEKLNDKLDRFVGHRSH